MSSAIFLSKRGIIVRRGLNGEEPIRLFAKGGSVCPSNCLPLACVCTKKESPEKAAFLLMGNFRGKGPLSSGCKIKQLRKTTTILQ